jgi:hypothetical protein
MHLLGQSLLTALAIALTTCAPYVPHPYDRLIAALAQLCFFVAELLK